VARSIVQFDETFTSVMALVARVVDFTIGSVAFVEEEDLNVVLMHYRKASPVVIEETKKRLLEVILERRAGAAFARIHARLFTPASGPTGAEETTLRGFACFPIVTGDRLVGLLALAGKNVALMNKESEEFLDQVANQAFIVMENSRLFERVRNMSIRDSLTELFNHRHSIELLTHEFHRMGRYQQEGVSVLMIDIDHFKEINDDHGHLAGDMVLREVARLLTDSVRTVDSVGRYGGEEFLLVLPHTTRADAVKTAERIRKRIEEHAFWTGEKELEVTVSVGISSFPAEGVDSPSALLREADIALYRAKESGRNRVV